MRSRPRRNPTMLKKRPDDDRGPPVGQRTFQRHDRQDMRSRRRERPYSTSRWPGHSLLSSFVSSQEPRLQLRSHRSKESLSLSLLRLRIALTRAGHWNNHTQIREFLSYELCPLQSTARLIWHENVRRQYPVRYSDFGLSEMWALQIGSNAVSPQEAYIFFAIRYLLSVSCITVYIFSFYH